MNLADKIAREVYDDENDDGDYNSDQGKVGAEVGIKSTDIDKMDEVCETDRIAKVLSTDTQEADDIASLKFGEDIKILLIEVVDYRVMCHFFGCNSVRDIQNAMYKHISLIGQLAQQCLIAFMKSEGFAYSGEVLFKQGQPVPCSKQTWQLKDREITFTNTGYLFFEAKSGKKSDNVVAFTWLDDGGLAGITLYSTSTEKSKLLLEKLEAFTKLNNCIRGSKLRDINMSMATFSQANSAKHYTWDNFYFTQRVRDMFELEVFGFVREIERYNKVGIQKRGLMLHGSPGTGKTSIGHIICNELPDTTVIWITPDLIAENNAGKGAIKLLYMLADFVAPSIIFLEDLDLFGEDRDSTQHDLSLGSLMNILDGVNQIKNAITIATTNRLELIEKALSNRPGRFDRVVEIPTMAASLRKKMFKNRFEGCKVDEGVIDHVVKLTDEWTGAQCQEFVNSMNLYFISVKQDKSRHVTKKIIDDVFAMITDLSAGMKSKKKAGFLE